MDEKQAHTFNEFDFKEWLIAWNLTSIENILRDNKMTSMESLSMSNSNLSNLLSDKRICSNSKLLAMIINALQSLDSQNIYHSKKSMKRNCKNNLMPEMESKLNDMNGLENRLLSLHQNYHQQRLLQIEYLRKSKTKYMNNLNKSKNQIIHAFATIFDALKQKEHSLLSELDQYKVELHSIMDTHCDEKNDHNLFHEKYLANKMIIKHCKQIYDIMDLNTMYATQIKQFHDNEEYMKQQREHVEKHKYDINSVVFKLNEDAFANIIKEMDKIGEILKYKRLEIEIVSVEWSDHGVDHINIYYSLVNVDCKFMNTVNIKEYEIQYRYFTVDLDIDSFEWKTVSKRYSCSAHPIEIEIDSTNKRHISSDNDTWIFIKMRVKHNPYYIWSGYSATFKRKVANFLIVPKGETVRLNLSQKKRKASSRRSSTEWSADDGMDEYHQYYTFDSIIIRENAILTIENNKSIIDKDDMVHPKGYLHLVIHRSLRIYKGGKITVSGLGYAGGTRYESGDSVNSFGELGQTENNKGGGGGSKTYELGCGGGGGYGTNGSHGCSGKGFGFGNNKTKYRRGIDGDGGIKYGDLHLSVVHFGSGGGGGDYGDSKGGNGGGIIIIDCKKDIIMDELSALQANGHSGKYDSDGCGSGGSIFINCKSLSMSQSAKIEAIGGKNNLKGHGGDGGHGRIRIKCETKNVSWNKYDITPRPYVG